MMTAVIGVELARHRGLGFVVNGYPRTQLWV